MNKTSHLISVAEASDIILKATEDFGTEEVPFHLSMGRVLKEDILADRDLPPFNRVSMDGIAIDYSSFQSGIRKFKIEGIQAAGSPQQSLRNTNNCLEAMTGAMLPAGTDVVIPYELIEIKNNIASVTIDEIRSFQNIHKQGLDRKKSDLLIPKNTVISSAEMGVISTVGKNVVKVAKLPRIAIITTGDELVDVDQEPQPYQIRKSNVHTMASLLEQEKIKAVLFHLPDNKKRLLDIVKKLLQSYDVLMFSGAVSKGKFDFLPEVLQELCVEKLFHKVKQRPGKPFWFGKKDKTTVFAFPGNPVSTYVSCLKYFFPWLRKSLGIEPQNNQFAILARNFEFKPVLNYFLQVKLTNNNGVIMADPVAGNGSGDLANLTLNDAFLELPADRHLFKKGDAFPLIKYRN